ncbi:MAG: protein kinase [Sandaracinaceae bacterium]|nr:protein kinase [Sandaracinaceae bacterium]
MGSVWLAQHIELESSVAVKFLHAHGPQSESLVTRFLREAKAAAAIRHRNVVSTTDFGISDDGEPYMVMELLEGESLAQRLERSPPLTVPELVNLLSLSLGGLAAVHAAGIIHRDLKPENIFLVRDDDAPYPKLIDFGVSRGAPGSTGSSATQSGLLVGTPHYMSPEQARGLKTIDYRTDIYSMGVILYEALSGVLPYDSENVGDLIMMVTTGGAPPLSTYRPDLGQMMSDVIAKAMSQKPEDRFQTAREMRLALYEAAVQLVPEMGRPTQLPGGGGMGGGMGPRILTPDELIAAGAPAMSGAPDAFGLSTPPAIPVLSVAAPAYLASNMNVPKPAAVPNMPSLNPEEATPYDAVLANSSSPEMPGFSDYPRAKPKGSSTKLWTIVFAAIAIVGFGTAIFWPKAAPQQRASTTPPATPQGPTPAATQETGAMDLPTTPTTVQVTLDGVIDGARVIVDGHEMASFPVRGGDPARRTLELTGGDHVYAIEVNAEGRVPWRVGHPGSSGAEYRVVLEPSARAANNRIVRGGVARPGVVRGGRPGATPAPGQAGQAAQPQQGVFRDVEF